MNLVTREIIVNRVDALLQGKISTREFGEVMHDYMLSVGQKYMFDKKYEALIWQVLHEFIDMHNIGKDNPRIPLKEDLLDLKKRLLIV